VGALNNSAADWTNGNKMVSQVMRACINTSCTSCCPGFFNRLTS
jgi:hypothetical protein